MEGCSKGIFRVGAESEKGNGCRMTAQEIIRELPKGLIKWHKFEQGGKALLVTAGMDIDAVMAEALAEVGLDVVSKGISELKRIQQKEFDYAVIIGAMEHTKDFTAAKEILRRVYSALNEKGKLLLGMDNRLGIRYFCGDRDLFTGRNFDSVENYARINVTDMEKLDGRTYSKAEIEDMLKAAGFGTYRFYSVFPVLFHPQILFADDYVPQEELDVRIFPQYNYADTVFLEEEKLYSTLIQNGMFHTMANGFLIECPKAGAEGLANVRQITVSMDRGKQNAMYTIIGRNEKVEKKPVYSEGLKKIKELAENDAYLRSHGVNMVEADMLEGTFSMAYQHGIPAVRYFRTLLCTDQTLFLEKLDEFWKIILNSSEHVPYEEIDWERFEPGWEKRKPDDPNKDKWRNVAFGPQEDREALGVILRRGYIDLVALNCFWTGEKFVFYDQEIYVENLPAKAIFLRTINFIYSADLKLETILPGRKVKEYFNLERFQPLFAYFTDRFLNRLRNDDLLKTYHNEVRRDMGIINSNRQRMNYSADRYDSLFRDIFKGTEGKKLYLFGSGAFTKIFLSQFAEDYPIKGILDNNADKWGEGLNGIPIYAPDILKEMIMGTYKVIICIKNYIPVMKQLEQLGVKDYSIFDSNLKYPRKMKPILPLEDHENHKAKRYHIGYIAGVFDLFHIGHLNMFKRAKEQCDYLIVGVVNDEGVRQSKRTMPYMPFEERIELVRSCRYVDEAVEIPAQYNNTDEAYRRYQFDVQFSGSDYAENPVWLAKQAFLRKQGSDMVFFPYTESTSSTKLKALIEKGLL